MRIVLQRVSQASVAVGGEVLGEIGRGLLLLVGIGPGDAGVNLAKAADKICTLRIFNDEAGKMNRSLLDEKGEILAVSQFTLYGNTAKGRRPSFVGAAPPERAEPLFDSFVAALRASGVRVETGRFGATMSVALVNDGPVTLVLEVAPSDQDR